jgi:branched-chain amino acid transport system permease protein
MRDALCASEPGVGLVIQMVVLCLVALSAWLVLRVGRISLGQQAYFGIGGYCAALLTSVGQWPLDAALLAATLAGVLSAALVAGPLLRLPGLHYAVATLAVAELVRLGLSGWRYQVPQASGHMAGPDGVHGFRDIRWLFDHQVGQTEYMVWSLLALALVVIALLLLSRSRLGLAMQAVGHDALLADSQGLPVQRIRWAAMAAAGGVAAFAGGLYAHQLTYLEPAIFDPMLGIHAVGYSMLGGLATPLGPLLGAAFDLGLLEATRLFEGWRMVLFGTLVAVFLRWRPRGLLDETLAHRCVAAWRVLRAHRISASPASGQA